MTSSNWATFSIDSTDLYNACVSLHAVAPNPRLYELRVDGDEAALVAGAEKMSLRVHNFFEHVLVAIDKADRLQAAASHSVTGDVQFEISGRTITKVEADDENGNEDLGTVEVFREGQPEV
jgi:hypothetical protein